jgi:hypothetical protein
MSGSGLEGQNSPNRGYWRCKRASTEVWEFGAGPFHRNHGLDLRGCGEIGAALGQKQT